MKENNGTFEKGDSFQTEAIVGRGAVLEALRSERTIEYILIAKGERSGSMGKLISVAREKGIIIKDADSKKLDAIAHGTAHQGVAAMIAAHSYATLDEVFKLAEKRGQSPFIVICDSLEDPHNLGAIIRTAECVGAHGVVIPSRRSVGLTTVVAKASCGALEYIPVVKVVNLATTVEELKKRGVFIYGADMTGKDFRSVDYSGGVGLVVGAEGNGISRLIKEKCDFLVSLPMKGRIESLNASVAAGVLMYEIGKGR